MTKTLKTAVKTAKVAKAANSSKTTKTRKPRKTTYGRSSSLISNEVIQKAAKKADDTFDKVSTVAKDQIEDRLQDVLKDALEIDLDKETKGFKKIRNFVIVTVIVLAVAIGLSFVV